MTCPYCAQEMQRGIIIGNGRRGVTWRSEKMWEGPERIRVATFNLFTFKVETFYCKKMIIDTANKS